MSLRNASTKKLEATIIVVVSTGLAIISAHHFEHSGPDEVLLRQLKEMQEARENGGDEMANPRPVHGSWETSPLPVFEKYAQR